MWRVASIYQRGGRWWVSYTDPAMRRRVQRSLGRHVTTEAMARRAARELERDLDAPRPPVGVEPLLDVVEDFLADKQAKRESATWKSYRKHLRPFVDDVGERRPFGEIDEATIERHLAKRAQAGLGRGTANAVLTTLRVLWRWARKKKRCRETPPLDVEPYSVRPGRRTPPTLAQVDAAIAELRAMADSTARTWERGGVARARTARPDELHAAGLYADLLELCSWTGLRPGEVARLQPADVDLDAFVLTVRSAANKGPRMVPLAPRALEIVRRRLGEGRPTVFAAYAGGPAGRAMELFGKGWREGRPELRLVVPHGIRHLVADRLREAKVDPITRARLLGHQTLQMHAHYSHEHIEELRAAVESLGGAAARAPRRQRSGAHRGTARPAPPPQA